MATRAKGRARRFYVLLLSSAAMSSPIIAPLLSGKVIGSTDNTFVIAEWRDAGGLPGPPRLIAPPHVHHSDDEAWYVLEGSGG